MLKPQVWVSLTILGFLAIFALIGPWLSSYGYDEIHLSQKNSPPDSIFWFGSDELGRDLFTRIWWGARISLFIGAAAAVIDLSVGIFWGSVAAIFGGKIEEAMMRICDILYAIPYLLVVILLTVVLGSGIKTLLIAMTCTGWIGMARMIRGQILQIKSLDYVTAARSMGGSATHILLYHLLPNAVGSIIATATLTIRTAILTEAFLSFLGLGIQAPAASWGMMISDGLSGMRYYPWRLAFPSAMIILTMLALHLLSDAIRDASDPRLKNQ